MTGQETRNKLTDYWANHDIKQGEEFAILTNIIHQEWSGVSVKAHKEMKGLQDHNLRDHMSEAELIFTALAELSTRQIAETDEATGMAENTRSCHQGRSDCQTGAQGAGGEDRQAGGFRRQFPAARQARTA
jgi:DNA-damage-inducible protein D